MNEPISRAKRPQYGFTQVDNILIRDSRISFEAKGLLIYVLALPDDFVVSKRLLMRHTKIKRHSIDRIFSELKEVGYLSEYEHIKIGSNGEYSTKGYHFSYEAPEISPDGLIKSDFFNPDKSLKSNLTNEAKALISPLDPLLKNSTTPAEKQQGGGAENQHYPPAEKQHTKKKEYKNTDIKTKYTPISPEGTCELPLEQGVPLQEQGDAPQQLKGAEAAGEILSPNSFAYFHKHYPGKKNSAKTDFERFKKKHKDWEEVEPILTECLRREYAEKKHLKDTGAFCPQWKNLSTYLNQRAWELYLPENRPDPVANRNTDLTLLFNRDHEKAMAQYRFLRDRVGFRNCTKPELDWCFDMQRPRFIIDTEHYDEWEILEYRGLPGTRSDPNDPEVARLWVLRGNNIKDND